MKSLHILPCAVLATCLIYVEPFGEYWLSLPKTHFWVHHVFYQCYHLGKWYDCYINILYKHGLFLVTKRTLITEPVLCFYFLFLSQRCLVFHWISNCIYFFTCKHLSKEIIFYHIPDWLLPSAPPNPSPLKVKGAIYQVNCNLPW